MVETRLTLFEEVARVPVLLSLLLVVLGDALRRFPESVPQLYEFAVQAATQRAKLANAPTVLRRLGVENMQRRRRAFTGAELTANGGPSDGGGLPLLKVLAEGATADQTEYQFVHLTIQEALYGLALRSNDVAGAWATDEEAVAFLNDPFMRNTLALDGAGIGRHFAQLRPAWEFQRNIPSAHAARLQRAHAAPERQAAGHRIGPVARRPGGARRRNGDPGTLRRPRVPPVARPPRLPPHGRTPRSSRRVPRPRPARPERDARLRPGLASDGVLEPVHVKRGRLRRGAGPRRPGDETALLLDGDLV